MPQVYGERTIRMVHPKTGAVQDVLERNLHAVASQGFISICDSLGPTSVRPTTGLVAGHVYIDTTLGKAVFWVGGGGGIVGSGPEPGFWCDYTGAPA
jgi:hypothetical protein